MEPKNGLYSPGDFGMAALLYFGEFSNGELELGAPFSKIVPVRNGELIFKKQL
jgi:hypothetical protein